MKMNKFTLSVMFLLGSLYAVFGNSEPFRQGIMEGNFVYESASFPSCHSATIAETPGGLVTAFFGGTRERHPDVCIYVCRKEGNDWTAPEEVADGVVHADTRYPTWNPVLYQVPGGELILFYKVGPSPSTWKGMLKRSFDNGITWTAAEALPEGFIGPVKNKPILLEGNRLMCASSTEGDGWRVHFEVTEDWGKTWEKIGPINDTKTYEAIQPSLLKHPDGRLQILCRSKNAVIVEAWSEDNGDSWSLLQASALPSNNSGIDAVALKDGRFLLVYNHVKTPQGAKKGYRTPLNVAVSEDGIDWSAALVLENSQISQYSYPSVIQSKDGFVHVVYTWRREKIKYMKLDPFQLNSRPILNEEWPR